MAKKNLFYFLTALLLTWSGCTSSKSVSGGKLNTVDVSKLNISQNSPMVAEKNYVPLEIVLDPNEIPDQVTVKNDQSKIITIRGIHSFIKRDLKNAFSEYFKEVRIVSEPSKTERTVYAKVRIKDFAIDVDKSVSSEGGVTEQKFGAMNWSVAFGFSNREDFFYSYSDRVFGSYAGTGVDDGPQVFQSVFENALATLFQNLTMGRVIIGIK